MSVRIFLDDLRSCPDGYTLCRTAAEAIAWLRAGDVAEISFDHDLGTDETGYTVACTIERLIVDGKLTAVPIWKIHSANPVGAENIRQAMLRAERFCNQPE